VEAPEELRRKNVTKPRTIVRIRASILLGRLTWRSHTEKVSARLRKKQTNLHTHSRNFDDTEILRRKGDLDPTITKWDSPESLGTGGDRRVGPNEKHQGGRGD